MALTGMMQQYLSLKEQHKDSLLFFRLGDFYEMFFSDAEIASKELGLTLTGRDAGLDKRVPMCGVPYHSVDNYIKRLIDKGFSIAICEQMTDAKSVRKGAMMDRAVVRVITPGTVVESDILNDKASNFILCAYLTGSMAGLCYADISTGEIWAQSLSDARHAVFEELARIRPTEVLVNDAMGTLLENRGYRFTVLEAEAFEFRSAAGMLRSEYPKKFDALSNDVLTSCAAGALMKYIAATQMRVLKHIRPVQIYDKHAHLSLDPVARQNLELTATIREGKREGSLLGVLDRTITSMGSRLIHGWIEEPYRDIGVIYHRQGAVGALKDNPVLLGEIRECLKCIADIERMASQLAYASFSARGCLQLKESLVGIQRIKALLDHEADACLGDIHIRLDHMPDIQQAIGETIRDDLPQSLKEGGIIRRGLNAELDAAMDAAQNGEQWISDFEAQERERTGIKNLKIGYNGVFGYFIEVTKSNLPLVPLEYRRKQTLSSCERFSLAELAEMEKTILGAKERAVNLEYMIFCELRERIYQSVLRLQSTAAAVKELDALASLAYVAGQNDYVCPQLHDGYGMEISGGRHPVVERFIESGFVPNDALITEDERVVIITGPNMAGKSTYMRQVAHITLMAHMGSFVPAARARIPLTDRIFTRIGASDNLASGKSTFMVEMTELADILKGATDKSLLIIDEIGRGTSTFDGLSIAWAAVEHISDKQRLGAKTLFATHYHELTELEGSIEGVVNYNILTKEHGDEVIFLRKIVRGGANRSFGVQVGQMAGLPQALVARAREIMAKLDAADITKDSIGQSILNMPEAAQKGQMTMDGFASVELCEEIKMIDVNAMTPVEALNTLYQLREKARRV